MSELQAHSKIMTRKATTHDLELKLKLALEEVKELKKDNSQLLQERDESEEEFLKVIGHNNRLKTELTGLHTQLVEAVDQRDTLRRTVGDLDRCSETYEQALGRIHELEVELRDANKRLQQYEEDLRCQEGMHTRSLYEELIGSPAQQNIHYLNQECENSIVTFKSKNKFKKYIKISKFIRKTEHIVKRQKYFTKNILLRKQKIDLMDSLELYSQKLEHSRHEYDRDTQELQADITRLQESLQCMTDKYKSAQAQINEHILAVNQLIAHCSCNQSTGPSDQKNVGQRVPCDVSHTNKTCISPKKTHDSKNVFVFSDGVGVGFGRLFKIELNCNILTTCMPDASLTHICERIKECKFNQNSVIVLMLGNGLMCSKKEIINCSLILTTLKVKKVILCAFPFSKNYTCKQNNSIHLLNTLLYNLTFSHSDKFVFFDTNKFIDNNLILTGKSFYLPNKYKKQLATLLAYNINLLFSQTLEHVPSSLNVILGQ